MRGSMAFEISDGVKTVIALVRAAVMLAACETPGDGSGNDADPAPQVTSDAVATTPEVAALPRDAKIDDDPERLIGLGSNGLYDLLGMPELVRRESPAQVWQYRGATCVFDVFLYDEGDDSRVTYVEARDTHGNAGEARQCLNELLRARLSPG